MEVENAMSSAKNLHSSDEGCSQNFNLRYDMLQQKLKELELRDCEEKIGNMLMNRHKKLADVRSENPCAEFQQVDKTISKAIAILDKYKVSRSRNLELPHNPAADKLEVYTFNCYALQLIVEEQEDIIYKMDNLVRNLRDRMSGVRMQKKERKEPDMKHENNLLKIKIEALETELAEQKELLSVQTRITDELKIQLSKALVANKKDGEERELMKRIYSLIDPDEIRTSKKVKIDLPQSSSSDKKDEVKLHDEVSNQGAFIGNKSDPAKQLDEKDLEIERLRKELAKKDAAMGELKAYNNELFTLQSAMSETLMDSFARIKEAEVLYKTQYMMIWSMKKKMKYLEDRDYSDKASQKSEATQSSIPQGNAATAVKINDCDTGEHVTDFQDLTDCVEVTSVSDNEEKSEKNFSDETLAERGYSTPLIYSGNVEMKATTEVKCQAGNYNDNFAAEGNGYADFKVPCELCNKVIDMNVVETGLVDHLEKEHKQLTCPFCAKHFDMNLPLQYFYFHVEDHFMLH